MIVMKLTGITRWHYIFHSTFISLVKLTLYNFTYLLTLFLATVLHIIGVDITPVTARQTDDFTLDMTTVAVANYNIASITVTGVLDTVIEGVEALFLCITPNAVVYNIDQPSCTTIYIQGKYLQVCTEPRTFRDKKICTYLDISAPNS